MTIDPKIREAAAGIGDNSDQVPEDFRIKVTPPEDIAPYLNKTYKELSDRYTALMASASQMPEKIENDVDVGKAGDLIKEMRLLEGRLESARDVENDPFKKGKGVIDAFFKNLGDPLEKAKKKIVAIQTDYNNAKKAAEQRRLQAEAQKKRDEELRLQQEAAETAERKRVADEARGEADEKAREARENKDELEQERLNAESELAKAKLRKAEARRDRNEDAFNTASADVEEWKGKLVVAKENLTNARKAQRLAAQEADRLAQQSRKAAQEHGAATDNAELAGKSAEKLETALNKATDGDLVRSRSELGTTVTQARRWVCTIEDVRLVHQNAQMYIGLIDPEVLRVAIGKRMAAGNRDVPGVKYEHVAEARNL